MGLIIPSYDEWQEVLDRIEELEASIQGKQLEEDLDPLLEDPEDYEDSESEDQDKEELKL